MKTFCVKILLFLAVIGSLIQIKSALVAIPELSFTFDDTNFGYFSLPGNNINWGEADGSCRNNWGGHLATIKSEQVDSLFYYTPEDIEIHYSCHIGLNDMDNEAVFEGSNFVWVDGSNSSYRQFGNTGGEIYPIYSGPDDPNDCVTLRYRSGGVISNGWSNGHCAQGRNCYFCNTPATHSDCDLIYNGSCYRLYEVSDGINWLDAQSSCAIWGGDLTSITTERENNYLYTIIPDTVSNCWIGLNDRDGNGTYTWIDGLVSSHTNWTSTVPSVSDEDCVEIIRAGEGSWETVSCEVTRNAFLCKRPSSITGDRFGELTNGGLDFEPLSGNKFLYETLTLACGAGENNSIVWRFSLNSDLSPSVDLTLTAIYNSTQTGFSWLDIYNTKQGYYQCRIGNTTSFTIGLFNETTTIAGAGNTYTYTVGIDREDALLLCDPMNSSYSLSSLMWSIQGGSTLDNPINLFERSSTLTEQSNQWTCVSSGNTIQSNTINVYSPTITVPTSNQQFTTIYPGMNNISLQIGLKDFSMSTNLQGRWKLPDGTNSSSHTIFYATLAYDYFGLYQFYIINWDGIELLAMQAELIPDGYFVTSTISTSTDSIQNDSTIVLKEDSAVIECSVSNLGDSIQWYYSSTKDDLESDTTSSSTFTIETGISSLTVNSNEPGYYSCVINSDMVYTFFVVNTDSLVEITSFDNPSQQVDYDLDSAISLLYYSDDIFPDSFILWTTDNVEDGDILTYSVEYPNPAPLSTVFNDVGAGVQMFFCFYRMSPVTLFGSVQLALKDTATITVTYEGDSMSFSDLNNPMFPSPQEISITLGTRNISLTCSLPECVWMIPDETTTTTTSTYIISELTDTNSGTFSLMRVTSTGISYTTAHVSIRVLIPTPTAETISPVIFIVVAVIIIMVIAVVLLIAILTLVICCKKIRRNTRELPKQPEPSDLATKECKYDSDQYVIHNTPSTEYIDLSGIERPDYTTIDDAMAIYGGYYSNEIFNYEPNDSNTEYVEVNNNVSDQTDTPYGHYRRPNSRFIATKNFPATCQLFVESGMGANSLFSVEFQNLNKDTNSIAQPECTEALKTEKVPKSSINNIPFDENRVVLSSPHFDCNYINASYINESQFIACIHPTKEDHLDFLQMIYQTEASMVVMLTTRKEKTKIISGYSNRVCYWPKKDKSLTCKPFVTKLIASTETTAFVKQEISLKNTLDGKEHSFTHCISPVWNEDGTVAEISCVIALLIRIMKQSQEEPSKPIIIHCEDGIAKTGIVITTINSVKELTIEKTINIFNTVKNLRRQRMNMVPTLACYATCFSLMNEYCTIHF